MFRCILGPLRSLPSPRAFVLGAAFALAGVGGCSSTGSPPAAPTVSSTFDVASSLGGEAFFDLPFPSDARLNADGGPDVAAFPDQGVSILVGLKGGAAARKGVPVVPSAYFRFTGALAPRDADTLVDGGDAASILLLDVDPASPDKGKAYPVVASTLAPDAYVPTGLLGVAAHPGIVLEPRRKYAFVVRRNVGAEGGAQVEPAPAFAALARGETPQGARGAELAALYAPLWPVLDAKNIPRADVASATVFTTGDVVSDTAALSERVRAQYTPSITGFALEADPTGALPEVCHVRATITLPQFQKGTPPFDTDGLFELGADGAPIKQRDEVVPVSITVPRTPMPAGGYPLVVYFHGSGGVSREAVDGGDKSTAADNGRWPSTTLARHGFAVAASALPASPERVPGAGSFDYLNLDNPIAMRDTFRQGIIEQRIFIEALSRVKIPAAALTGCSGPSLPQGETDYRFSMDPLSVQGQSMGGMYAHMMGAVEPRIRALVPTGGGGYWMYFILKTPKVPGAAGLLALLLKTPEKLNHLHPTMQIGEMALEPIDPIVSVPRLAHAPLPGHPTRSMYVPVGKGDSYFPPAIFDAIALAYAHPRVGDEVWPSMGEAQKLVGVSAAASYPVRENMKGAGGAYTSAVVQYAPTGAWDGHQIYRRLDEVIYQYGCFHRSFRKGAPVIAAPAPLGSPCPE
jgi:hypothetical protein